MGRNVWTWLSLVLFALAIPGAAHSKTKADATFAFPRDKPIRIILLRPDIEVGTIGASGVPTPNPDWTAEARTHLTEALIRNQAARQIEMVAMPALEGDDAAYLNEYQFLFRAVGNSVLLHNYLYRLPSKKLPGGKYKFDWTLGPGTQRLGQMAGGNYALLVYSYDAHATTGRKLLQGFLAVAFNYLPPGGLHSSFASLIDLESGNIVWFNFYADKKGDIRTKEGAQIRADKLLSTLPGRAGDAKGGRP
jgi:hypothetical protein